MRFKFCSYSILLLLFLKSKTLPFHYFEQKLILTTHSVPYFPDSKPITDCVDS